MLNSNLELEYYSSILWTDIMNADVFMSERWLSERLVNNWVRVIDLWGTSRSFYTGFLLEVLAYSELNLSTLGGFYWMWSYRYLIPDLENGILYINIWKFHKFHSSQGLFSTYIYPPQNSEKSNIYSMTVRHIDMYVTYHKLPARICLCFWYAVHARIDSIIWILSMITKLDIFIFSQIIKEKYLLLYPMLV